MQRDEFGPHLSQVPLRWLEPPWKAILSNKAILPILWEMFPESPYLLPASFEPLPGGNFVEKPIFGREGANIQVFEHGRLVAKTDGPYDGPAIYQQAAAALLGRQVLLPDRQLDRQRLGLRHRHPRGREPDYRQSQPLRAAYILSTGNCRRSGILPL